MKIGKTLVLTEFGSSIYGTRVPTSDRDLKGVFIPRYEDILLQRAGLTGFQESTKIDKTARNTSEDQDMEWFTLQSMIRLCSEGQSVALDLLFTPREFWLEHDPLWDSLVQQRSKLLCKKIVALVGYCRQQAARYGIKGSRLAAVRHVLEVLKRYPENTKMIEVDLEKLKSEIGTGKYIAFVKCRGPLSHEELHLEVCNRKVPIHAKFKFATEVFQRVFDQYGHRALLAEKNEGVDWKALMHAVRVAEEAKELLQSGMITFPRPEREFLLKIRKGELPYQEIAETIEQGLEDIETLQQRSQLAETIDIEYWESWVMTAYGNFVSEHFRCP